jgi:hypothetical protein
LDSKHKVKPESVLREVNLTELLLLHQWMNSIVSRLGWSNESRKILFLKQKEVDSLIWEKVISDDVPAW